METVSAPRISTRRLALRRLPFCLLLLLGAVPPDESRAANGSCEDGRSIGHFRPATDLFLAQFDIKTDVDDLHSAAAVATMLAAPELSCVRYLAVAGSYGTQEGDFVPAPALFERAFGARWRDAHGDRDSAVHDVARAAIDTLDEGGDIWIMEAGQSDFSAAVLARVLESISKEATRGRVHIVQHSEWNEDVTSREALAYVKRYADYRKIPDGNAVGNGSPGYRTSDAGPWERVLGDERVGDIWREARRVADAYNGVGYDNEAIRSGGFDFSDTVEAAYIFGFAELNDASEFVDYFLSPP